MGRSRSLFCRLFAAWFGFILLTLNVAGVGLVILFERSINRGTIEELRFNLNQLAHGLYVDASGEVKLTDVPGDPRFVAAHSGRYWQVSHDGKPVFRSASLWSYVLNVDPSAPDSVEPIKVRLVGPDDQDLMALKSTIAVVYGNKRMIVQIATAVDYAGINAAIRRFATELWIGLAGLCVLLVLAALVHVSVGLRPLKRLRNSLAAVRNGEAQRLEGDFPNEIMPLVAETNALLGAQYEALEAARTRSGNLAHGLQTPLAVMAAQSRALRRKGDVEIADKIDSQIEALRRHVVRELARTRARGGGMTRHARLDAAAALSEIANAFKHLPKGQELRWDLAVASPLTLAMDRSDFDDILGNLLDNSQKWAQNCVHVQARTLGRSVMFSVEDDGPGVPEDQLDRILQRGERGETSVPGSGLGLAIVSDLVSAYRGKLEIARSSLGGLKVAVFLPAF